MARSSLSLYTAISPIPTMHVDLTVEAERVDGGQATICRGTPRQRGTMPTHRRQQNAPRRLLRSLMTTAALVALCASSEVYGQASQRPSQGRMALAKKGLNLAPLTLASVSQPQAFNIASQPLDRALTAYSAQAHIQVLVAGELTSGLLSSGA
jgi:hypothetical protein